MSINHRMSITAADIRAVAKSVLVTDLERGYRRNAAGIIEVRDIDDKMEQRPPRWCKVHSVGSKAAVAGDIRPGQWVLVEYNRWTPRVELADGVWLNRVEDESILLASDDEPAGMHSRDNRPGI